MCIKLYNTRFHSTTQVKIFLSYFFDLFIEFNLLLVVITIAILWRELFEYLCSYHTGERKEGCIADEFWVV